MTALDTNVLIDLAEGSSEVAGRALAAVEHAAAGGRIIICGLVYAELCALPDREPDQVTEALRSSRIAIDTDLTLETLVKAGRAYAEYARRRKASGADMPRRILADFVIGAHAEGVGTLVTSDAAFYRRGFPNLRVIEPE